MEWILTKKKKINGVNHQLRPWSCKHQPKSSQNFLKYQFCPWNSLTSIKMVHPSKKSVSDAELTPCMFCSHVHVSKRKLRVQGLNWWICKKFSFHFSNAIFFCFFISTPVLSLPSTLWFQSYPSKQTLTILLPAKTFITFSSPKSLPSSAINGGFLKNKTVFG